jgi:hypothetical protein
MLPQKRYLLPIAKRQTLVESFHIAPLNRTVKLLVAVREDEQVVLEYICDAFIKEEPIDVASGMFKRPSFHETLIFRHQSRRFDPTVWKPG